MLGQLRASRVGSVFVGEATIIYGKALSGQAGKKEVAIYLNDMIRRMEDADILRGASVVRDCLDKVQNLP